MSKNLLKNFFTLSILPKMLLERLILGDSPALALAPSISLVRLPIERPMPLASLDIFSSRILSTFFVANCCSFMFSGDPIFRCTPGYEKGLFLDLLFILFEKVFDGFVYMDRISHLSLRNQRKR